MLPERVGDRESQLQLQPGGRPLLVRVDQKIRDRARGRSVSDELRGAHSGPRRCFLHEPPLCGAEADTLNFHGGHLVREGTRIRGGVAARPLTVKHGPSIHVCRIRRRSSVRATPLRRNLNIEYSSRWPRFTRALRSNGQVCARSDMFLWSTVPEYAPRRQTGSRTP